MASALCLLFTLLQGIAALSPDYRVMGWLVWPVARCTGSSMTRRVVPGGRRPCRAPASLPTQSGSHRALFTSPRRDSPSPISPGRPILGPAQRGRFETRGSCCPSPSPQLAGGAFTRCAPLETRAARRRCFLPPPPPAAAAAATATAHFQAAPLHTLTFCRNILRSMEAAAWTDENVPAGAARPATVQ